MPRWTEQPVSHEVIDAGPSLECRMTGGGRGKQDSAAAVVYIRLTDEYARINMGEAKKCALQAEALCRKLGLAGTLSAAYSELTTLNVQTNQPDSARYYRRAIVLK